MTSHNIKQFLELHLDSVELLFHRPQAALGLLIMTLQLSLQTLNPALQQSSDAAWQRRLNSIHTLMTGSRGGSVDQSRERVWVSVSQYLFQLLHLSGGGRQLKNRERKRPGNEKTSDQPASETCRSRSCILSLSADVLRVFLSFSLLLLLTSCFSFST